VRRPLAGQFEVADPDFRVKIRRPIARGRKMPEPIEFSRFYLASEECVMMRHE
jgi:hypothetical protein